ncbi:Phosphate transport system permease protein pstC [uncultured Clostridium sp.]|nr:Phosphate transport system permease protein pstC [uncultured Clostridium sp.]
MRGRKFNQKAVPAVAEGFFRLCAWISLIALAVIVIFLIIQGLPAFQELGLGPILFGDTWKPSADLFGIAPMIMASFLCTAGAVLIGSLIGIFTAMFLAQVAPARLAKLVRPLTNLLAGIPSVVFGFFGMVVLVPLISQVFGGTGNSALAVIIILAVMILPTVISIGETALRAVPKEYQEGSLALGASPMQTLMRVTLPAAKSGILTAIVLAVGRAIGETMAVILVAGNRAFFPTSLLDPVRPMTANIALELSYASGLHEQALYATGLVLLAFIVIINLVAHRLAHGKKDKS